MTWTRKDQRTQNKLRRRKREARTVKNRYGINDGSEGSKLGWPCPRCNTNNRALLRRCRNCGKYRPRTKHAKDILPAHKSPKAKHTLSRKPSKLCDPERYGLTLEMLLKSYAYYLEGMPYTRLINRLQNLSASIQRPTALDLKQLLKRCDCPKLAPDSLRDISYRHYTELFHYAKENRVPLILVLGALADACTSVDDALAAYLYKHNEKSLPHIRKLIQTNSKFLKYLHSFPRLPEEYSHPLTYHEEWALMDKKPPQFKPPGWRRTNKGGKEAAARARAAKKKRKEGPK